MRTTTRGLLGLVLALPLLFGPTSFALAGSSATSQLPAVAAQVAPQQGSHNHHHCHGPDQGYLCHEHEHQHTQEELNQQEQHHRQEHHHAH
ncbi:hypothetical protein [Saccharopolyspora thermophila]|uniref:hypothetical protein n=1 Tax=Saccharopolyspora thermophila TaxID=89367 RepID=UPI00166AE1BE|nr:hypothetical protein [Saccharopolyspora subtropica]